MSKDTVEGAVVKELMDAASDTVVPKSTDIKPSEPAGITKSENSQTVDSSVTVCEDKSSDEDSKKKEVEPSNADNADTQATEIAAVGIPKDSKPIAAEESDKTKDTATAKGSEKEVAESEVSKKVEEDAEKAEECSQVKAEGSEKVLEVAEEKGHEEIKEDSKSEISTQVKTEASDEVKNVATKETACTTEIKPGKDSEAETGAKDSGVVLAEGDKTEESAIADAEKPAEKPTDSDEGIEIKVEEAVDALKADMQDNVSVLSVAGSADSDVTPPVTCFNWFKPQRFMSRLRSKRDKSHKAGLPSLKSQVSDPNESAPEDTPETKGKIYSNEFIAVFNDPDERKEVERIDYSCLSEDKIIPTYLCAHPCYEIMPTSGKVIILSVELLVKNAFSALVSNDIKAAPLWDASYFDFVGMLTISDFINVLRHYYYSSPEDIKDIENQSISTWRRITKVEKPFVKVGATESLFQATKLLIQEGVHRIPVFDEKRQSVLFVLTRKRLLHYLCNSLFENFEKLNARTPNFFRETIGTLKIGTFEDIATVNINTKVIDALDLFVKRNVSSLPVVDKDNILQDIFEKFDVFQLAKEQTYHNLDMEIKEAISKAGVRETAWICSLDETFGTVINRFVNNKVHRIVVIDKDRKVVGIISLSDILKFLAVNPMENEGLPSTTETILEVSEGAAGGSSLESSQKAEEDSVSEAVSTLKIEDHPKAD